jgi:hypothetical protein
MKLLSQKRWLAAVAAGLLGVRPHKHSVGWRKGGNTAAPEANDGLGAYLVRYVIDGNISTSTYAFLERPPTASPVVLVLDPPLEGDLICGRHVYPISVSAPDGGGTGLSYDLDQPATEPSGPRSGITTYAYYSTGHLALVVDEPSDPDARVTTYAYSGTGSLSPLREAAGDAGEGTSYAYDVS